MANRNTTAAESSLSTNPQQELLDAVFSMLETEPELLANVIPAPKPWVLCIDDDYEFSLILSQRLESLGIGVINAYEGMDGIKTAFACPANAILLDYNMPNGCGDEVLQALKRSPATRDIPVIVLTGNKDPRVKSQMINMGADALFYKPPSFETLIEELRRFVPITDSNASSDSAETAHLV